MASYHESSCGHCIFYSSVSCIWNGWGLPFKSSVMIMGCNWEWSKVYVNWERSKVYVKWEWSKVYVNWGWSKVYVNWERSKVYVNWEWSKVYVNEVKYMLMK
jgi:hypothetical protein